MSEQQPIKGQVDPGTIISIITALLPLLKELLPVVIDLCKALTAYLESKLHPAT